MNRSLLYRLEVAASALAALCLMAPLVFGLAVFVASSLSASGAPH